jgi:hypothetical protein
MFPVAHLPPKERTSALPVVLVHCFQKREFQDEQTAPGKYRRLPRIGHSGLRAIAEQFDDKFTDRGPAADHQSEFRLTVHNEPTIDIDTISHDIDAEYAVCRFRNPDAAVKLGGQPAGG